MFLIADLGKAFLLAFASLLILAMGSLALALVRRQQRDGVIYQQGPEKFYVRREKWPIVFHAFQWVWRLFAWACLLFGVACVISAIQLIFGWTPILS